MKRKGFTMIELLAVIVILATIATIAIFAYSSYISKSQNKAYDIAEISMEEATEGMFAKCYANNTASEMCELYGAPEDNERVLIYLDDLVEYGFIEAVQDPKSEEKNCDLSKSYVFAYANPKVSGNFDLEYSACLKCEGYETPDCDFELDVEQDFDLKVVAKYVSDNSIYDGSWTNKDVYLEFSAIDPYEFGIELYKASFTLNGGYKTVTSGKVYNTDMNETVYIRAHNKNKQVSAAVGHAVKIDKTKPKVNSISGNPTNWTSENVTLTVNASDTNGSGVVQYSFDNGSTWQTSNKKEFSNNQVVNVKVKDAVGHISDTKTITILYIDKSVPFKPTITSSSNGNWSTTDITLTLQSSAGQSGLYYQYSYDQSSWTTWSNSNSNQFTPPAFTQERNQNVYIRACTPANVCSEVASTPIKLDKTKPVINSVTGNATSWINGSVTLTVNATDGGGSNIASANAYSFDNGSTWQTAKTKTFTTNQTVNIKVKDTAGNVSNVSTVTINKIDTSTPSTPTITNSSGGSWTNSDVTLTLKSSVGTSGIYYQYSTDNKTWTTWSNSNSATFTPAKYTSNTNMTLYVRACTNAGVCSASANTTIKIDKTAPTCGTISGASTTWTSSNRTVSVACTDTYGECSQSTFSNTYSSGKTQTATITISDKAGNTKGCTVNAYVDKTKYTVTVTNVTGGTFSVSATSAMMGTSITVTATPSTNYKLKTIKAGSTDITSAKKFTMPRSNITVTGTWEMTVITKYRYKDYVSKTCRQSKTCYQSKTCTGSNCGYSCYSCCGSASNWACACCTGAASPDCGPSSASGSCCGNFHCCSNYTYDCSYNYDCSYDYDCSYWGDWSSWSTTACSTTSTRTCESATCLASSSSTGCTAP